MRSRIAGSTCALDSWIADSDDPRRAPADEPRLGGAAVARRPERAAQATPRCSAGSCAGASPGSRPTSPSTRCFAARRSSCSMRASTTCSRASSGGSGPCAATTRCCRDPTPFGSTRHAGPCACCSPAGREDERGRRARPGALCSEVRVEAFGRQGRIGLATVRPLVRGFQQLIGSDGIAAAVRRAERDQGGLVAAARVGRLTQQSQDPVVQFDSEVTVRRQRFSNQETGWAVLEAILPDGSPVVLVGALAHLEERERAQRRGQLGGQSLRTPGQGHPGARPAPDRGGGGPGLSAPRAGGRGAPGATADRGPRRRGGDRRHRPRSAVGSGRRGDGRDRGHAGAGRLGASARDAPAAPAARAARSRPPRGGDSHRVRRRRPPLDQRPALRPHARVRGRLRHRRPDRSRTGRGRRRARARPRRGEHVLAEAERAGSTCLPVDELARRLTELLGARPAPGTIDVLVRRRGAGPRGGLDLSPRDGRARARAGRAGGRARRIARTRPPAPARTAGAPAGSRRRDGASARAGRGDATAPSHARRRAGPPTPTPGRALTEEQETAVQGALKHRLSLITGGPGTGKTATVRAIVTAAEEQGLRVLLVAPTGRAAARMREASGVQAATVHSALGWIPGEGPTHDARGPAALRPARGRRDLDGQPRAARHAAARGACPGHRGAGRRRRPTRSGRRGQAVCRARRRRPRADHAPVPHLSPGGGEHDRPGRPRDPARPTPGAHGGARACAATCS